MIYLSSMMLPLSFLCINNNTWLVHKILFSRAPFNAPCVSDYGVHIVMTRYMLLKSNMYSRVTCSARPEVIWFSNGVKQSLIGLK